MPSPRQSLANKQVYLTATYHGIRHQGLKQDPPPHPDPRAQNRRRTGEAGAGGACTHTVLKKARARRPRPLAKGLTQGRLSRGA